MNRTQTGWTMLVGGALAILGGAFLPWITFFTPLAGTITVSGAQGDGLIAVVAGGLAIMAGLLTLRWHRGSAPIVLAWIGAGGVVLVTMMDFPNVYEVVSDTAGAQMGTGIWALVVSSAALVIGAVFLTRVYRLVSKAPRGVDDDALSARTQELMESEGIKWTPAYQLAVAELSETVSVPAT